MIKNKMLPSENPLNVAPDPHDFPIGGLTHIGLWTAIDKLAARLHTTPSGLARQAGLDPTIFNRSKRESAENPPRPRWPSTESLAKLMESTRLSFVDFARLADGSGGFGGIPLIGFAQAGSHGFFDDQGYPLGHGWDEIHFPSAPDERLKNGHYALEISGDSMHPVYRDGDRIIVDPHAQNLRRGDRVVVKTTDGEVMAKELLRLSNRLVELKSLNPEYEDRSLDRLKIQWIARIIWASQ
jgi:phage repressor protein C with HTH and peptisase S24 domain